MKKKFGADAIGGIITVLFGLFFLVNTIIDPNMTFGIGKSDHAPGPGFYPYILSVLVIVFGIALVIVGLKAGEKKVYFDMTDERKVNIKMMLELIAGILVFLAFWKLLAPNFGDIIFYIGVFALELFMNKIFERKTKFAVIYAIVFTLFVFAVFKLGFKISFNA